MSLRGGRNYQRPTEVLKVLGVLEVLEVLEEGQLAPPLHHPHQAVAAVASPGP